MLKSSLAVRSALTARLTREMSTHFVTVNSDARLVGKRISFKKFFKFLKKY